MRDINELVVRLKVEINKADKEGGFTTIIKEIEKYYLESLFLEPYEVAIFLANKEKTVLSFSCPEYLVNAGMIPVSSTEAYTASIFRSGRSVLENNFQQQKHLGIFEIIRTPEGKIMPLWKVMGALIAVENEKIGVIQISRRGTGPEEVGEDFAENDLIFLEKSIKILAPYIKRAMPEDFRGRIT